MYANSSLYRPPLILLNRPLKKERNKNLSSSEFSFMQQHFEQLNKYYDKIYVLSLSRLTERIDYINRALNGLRFEFFFGVDKQTVSLDELKQQGLFSQEQYELFYKKPKEIPLGMLCCSLGHLKIYEHIIENNFAKTLILEDDAVPVLDELNKFSVIIKELPDNWDLFYLGYEKNEKLKLKQKMNRLLLTTFRHHAQLKLTRDVFKNYYAVPVSPHISKAGFHDCTHAYAITVEGARKALAAGRPVRFNPDNLLAWLNCTGKMNGYVSTNKLFNQLSAFSNKGISLTVD